MTSVFSAVGAVFPGASVALDTRGALRRVVSEVEGLRDVRFLSRRDRARGSNRHKVFIVLGTHDIARDRRVMEIVSQLADVDVDLVPAASEGMIPDAAVSILQ